MKRSLVPWMAAAVVALAVLGGFWFRSSPGSNALRAREIATWHLADYLAKTAGVRRPLVVGNPFTQWPNLPQEMQQMETVSQRGLARGFGPQIVPATAFPKLKPGARENPRSIPIDPQTTTPLSYLVAPDAFDELAETHPDCDVMVSLIGLPAALDQVACWRKPGAPAFALLLPDLRMVGNPQAVQAAMQRGKLLALVLPHPNAPSSDVAVGNDWNDEFAKRFLLVTANNVEQLIQTYPDLFSPP
jgi:hypothetical protein